MSRKMNYFIGLLAAVALFAFTLPGSAQAADCVDGFTVYNYSDCVLFEVAVVWIPLEAQLYGGLIVPGADVTFDCPPGKTGYFGIATNGDSYGMGFSDWLGDCPDAATVYVDPDECYAVVF